MKKLKALIAIISFTLSLTSFGQTINSKIIENGGTGMYKAIAVADENFSAYTIYRPQNLDEAVAKEGKLPVLLHANGGCFNSSLTEEKGLTTIASNGYIVIAIGPFSEKSLPDNFGAAGAPGGNVPNNQEGNRPPENRPVMDDVALVKTSGKMLLEALDLIAIENFNQESEYYNKVDLDKVAVEGCSCGGLQAISISYDPRIKTTIMQNSGVFEERPQVADAPPMNIADMVGAEFGKADLKELHAPIVYIIGNETDVAYPNAMDDFTVIDHLPVAIASNSLVGHEGTSFEPAGGSFTTLKIAWLDWQLKNKYWKSAVFLDGNYSKIMFPDWTIQSKNF